MAHDVVVETGLVPVNGILSHSALLRVDSDSMEKLCGMLLYQKAP